MPWSARTEAEPLYELLDDRVRRVMSRAAIIVGSDAGLSRPEALLAEHGFGAAALDDDHRAMRRALEQRNPDTTAPTG